MVSDEQVRKLMKLVNTERNLSLAAAKAGMSDKTARKYLRSGQLPSEQKQPRTWRTRQDAFEAVWEELLCLLETNPGLEAQTLFGYLQRCYPGRFQDGQLRTLQRRIKAWRGLEGPNREVYFSQRHEPGALGQSDFTHMGALGVTIGGHGYEHLIYHFVLPYSNWETGMVCLSESFENLSSGLQQALFELGGVPLAHQSDRLSAAVSNLKSPASFTQRYQALLDHYGLEGRMIQAGRANENGDVEQRHHRFKRALDQALMLRGSRDFDSVEAYTAFLKALFEQLNAGRHQRFSEEQAVLRRLPVRKLDGGKTLRCRVSQGSTITVERNVYSVPSRLIGEQVSVRLQAEHLEVWYAQKLVERITRLRGRCHHRINYRHIIDTLVRKPGAFANYRYREDLFPTSRFRMALDALERRDPRRGHKVYLQILQLAAHQNEALVDAALRQLIARGQEIRFEQVEAMLLHATALPEPTAVHIEPVALESYDAILSGWDNAREEAR